MDGQIGCKGSLVGLDPTRRAQLGRKDKASDYFHAALVKYDPDDACDGRSRELPTRS